MGDLLGLQLAQPPQVGISNLRFAASGDLLLASSWDGVSYLSLNACALQGKVLSLYSDCCFLPSRHLLGLPVTVLCTDAAGKVV